MALPFADASFDAAVMALVLFFVPEPAKGGAEMARVVRPGGLVAAYLWDFAAGGFPFHPIQVEMRAMGVTPLRPPSVQASRMDMMHDLWAGAGFTKIESRAISVSRSFESFEAFWCRCRPESVENAVADNLGMEFAQPDHAVERIVANRLGRQHCQALAAVGGGQRPGFTMLAAQPKSATAADGCRNSSAKIYGFTPALTVLDNLD